MGGSGNLVLTDAASPTAVVTWVQPAATDNVPGTVTVVAVPASGSAFPYVPPAWGALVSPRDHP